MSVGWAKGVIRRDCPSCGLSAEAVEIVYRERRRDGSIARGSVFDWNPHKAPCGKDCAIAEPTPGWKHGDGVHVGGGKCLWCRRVTPTPAVHYVDPVDPPHDVPGETMEVGCIKCHRLARYPLPLDAYASTVAVCRRCGGHTTIG